MTIVLTKLAETDTHISLGWTPVPGATGYRFSSSLTGKKTHTWDPNIRRDANYPICNNRFAPGAEWYKVEALGVEDQGTYNPSAPPPPPPPPPPPTGSKLRWTPPALSNPVIFEATNSNRASGFLRSGGGRDLKIVCKEVLNGPFDEIIGWRHIVSIGGEFNSSANGSAGHMIFRENSGVAHVEGWKFRTPNANDFITVRFRQPYLQIQNCDGVMADPVAGSPAHSDFFQTQYAIIEEFRADKNTVATSYQGFFFSNEPMYAGQPAPSKVGRTIISRFKGLPGPQGPPATYLFKAIPPRAAANPLGPFEISDSSIPATDQPDFRVYPSSSGIDWAGNPTPARCYIEGGLLKFNAACDWVGHITLGGATVGAEGAGMNYVSPGYQTALALSPVEYEPFEPVTVEIELAYPIR